MNRSNLSLWNVDRRNLLMVLFLHIHESNAASQVFKAVLATAQSPGRFPTRIGRKSTSFRWLVLPNCVLELLFRHLEFAQLEIRHAPFCRLGVANEKYQSRHQWPYIQWAQLCLRLRNVSVSPWANCLLRNLCLLGLLSFDGFHKRAGIDALVAFENRVLCSIITGPADFRMA